MTAENVSDLQTCSHCGEECAPGMACRSDDPDHPGVPNERLCRPAESDADILRSVIFRMAEDITRIKVVCTQEHPPKMASPTRDWTPGTKTRHSDGSCCVLLNDGDWARLTPPGERNTENPA